MWLLSQNEDIFVNLSNVNCIYKHKKENSYNGWVIKISNGAREDIIAEYSNNRKVNEVIDQIFNFINSGMVNHKKENIFKLPRDSKYDRF